LHCRRERVTAGLAGVVFILRNQFLVEQFLLAVNWISAFSNCALSRASAACVGRGVNRKQPVVFFDLLAFLKMHLADDAAHLRADGHRRIWHHVADRRRIDQHRHVGLDGLRHEHRRTLAPGAFFCAAEQPLTRIAATIASAGIRIEFFMPFSIVEIGLLRRPPLAGKRRRIFAEIPRTVAENVDRKPTGL